jgi:hypothetical protein
MTYEPFVNPSRQFLIRGADGKHFKTVRNSEESIFSFLNKTGFSHPIFPSVYSYSSFDNETGKVDYSSAVIDKALFDIDCDKENFPGLLIASEMAGLCEELGYRYTCYFSGGHNGKIATNFHFYIQTHPASVKKGNLFNFQSEITSLLDSRLKENHNLDNNYIDGMPIGNVKGHIRFPNSLNHDEIRWTRSELTGKRTKYKKKRNRFCIHVDDKFLSGKNIEEDSKKILESAKKPGKFRSDSVWTGNKKASLENYEREEQRREPSVANMKELVPDLPSLHDALRRIPKCFKDIMFDEDLDFRKLFVLLIGLKETGININIANKLIFDTIDAGKKLMSYSGSGNLIENIYRSDKTFDMNCNSLRHKYRLNCEGCRKLDYTDPHPVYILA